MIYSIYIGFISYYILVNFIQCLSILKGVKQTRELSERNVSASIIIAAHNEIKNLKRLTSNILNQNHSNFELIISLDRCTDGSRDFLKKIDDNRLKFIEITDSPINWNPKKYALQQAIEKSTNQWLIFTDADCYAKSNEWLSHILSQISHNTKIIIGFSPYISNKSLLQSFIQFESIITGLMYLSSAILGKPYMAVGRNMAIEKSFFQKSGGYESFKNTLGGDDDLFIQKNATKQNTQVCIGESSNILTYPKKSLGDYFNQKLRHISIGNQYKKTDLFYLSILHSIHFFVWIIFLFHFQSVQFLVALAIYLLAKWLMLVVSAKKMGVNTTFLPFFPILDLIYSLMIPIVGGWSLFAKNIKWKK